MNQDIQNLVRAALECTYFINPRAPGLTLPELQEIASRAGYCPGETTDAIAHPRLEYRLLPRTSRRMRQADEKHAAFVAAIAELRQSDASGETY